MKSRKIKDDNDRLFENLVASVRNREPILENPGGLTENIMTAIHERSKESEINKNGKSGELPAIMILRRLLAAASVCLFLVFGYEEYVVVHKISGLEKQCSAISKSTQYQAALNMKKAMTILTINPEIIHLLTHTSSPSLNNSIQLLIQNNDENTIHHFMPSRYSVAVLRRLQGS